MAFFPSEITPLPVGRTEIGEEQKGNHLRPALKDREKEGKMSSKNTKTKQ